MNKFQVGDEVRIHKKSVGYCMEEWLEECLGLNYNENDNYSIVGYIKSIEGDGTGRNINNCLTICTTKNNERNDYGFSPEDITLYKQLTVKQLNHMCLSK